MKKIVALILSVLLFILTGNGAAWSSDRFLDNGNGTVTDTKTGLLWLKNANPCDNKNWADAMAYCNSLASGTAGLTDGSVAGQWRLPSKEELEGIGTDPPVSWNSGYPPVPWTIPGAPFYNVQGLSYWSSTTYDSNADYAWIVSGYYGFVSATNKSADLYLYYYLWPVRGESITTTTVTPTTTTTTIPNAGGEIIRITNDIYQDGCPKVDCQGNVYWIKNIPGPERSLMYYNGNEVIEVSKIEDIFPCDYQPFENGSKSVVYVKSNDIYLFGGLKEVKISNDGYVKYAPNVCNGYVVWVSSVPNVQTTLSFADREIFLYKPAQPTAVNMSALKATPSNKAVKLKWQTESEPDNAGFNIWRAEGFRKVTESIIPALGTSVSGSEYDFVDQWVLNGKRYFYLLEDIDTNGISTFHGPVKAVPRWWK